MPGGDGTGPRCAPVGRRGRLQGNRAGAGPVGDCVCRRCGERVPHQRGMPCYDRSCPRCGSKMVRG
jgi:hypothetical protein